MPSRQTKLLISLDPYSWVKYASGLVITQPKDFTVMTVSLVENRQFIWYIGPDSLCTETIKAQRLCDLRKIGKEIGVSKLINLGHDIEDTDIKNLTAQIQIQCMLGGIKSAYYQSNQTLDLIFKNLTDKFKIDIYSFGENANSDLSVELSDNVYRKKKELLKYMLGIFDIRSIERVNNVERFEKVSV